MTKVYFAGANTAPIARDTEGHPVLLTYASMVDGHAKALEQQFLPGLAAGRYDGAILDSGGFTVLSKGIDISVEDYAAFAVQHAHLFDIVVTLDDIAGDLATTWRNTAYLQSRGLDVMPVFHGGEPLAVLRHYCEEFGAVGLGFRRKRTASRAIVDPDQLDGLTPDEWLTACLDICEEYGVETHGFGMVRWALKLGHDRLTTADSGTWINEFTTSIKSIRCEDDMGEFIGGEAWEAMAALGSVDHRADDLMRQLVLDSYRGSGADFAMKEFAQDCIGQPRTMLMRFTFDEFRTRMVNIYREMSERFPDADVDWNGFADFYRPQQLPLFAY